MAPDTTKTVPVSLRDGVTVALKMRRYAHGPEYGSILLVCFHGIYDESHEACNVPYMKAMTHAGLMVQQSRGLILDLSRMHCEGGTRLRSVMLCCEPESREPIPYAVIANPSLRSAHQDDLEDLEKHVLFRHFIVDNWGEGLEVVLPQILRVGYELRNGQACYVG